MNQPLPDWEKEFNNKFPKGSLGCALRGSRWELMDFIFTLLKEEKRKVLKDLLAQWPEEMTIQGNGSLGYNEVLSTTKAIIEKQLEQI